MDENYQQSISAFLVASTTRILQEKRGILDEKMDKGIFLGYSTQTKGYRVYNLRTKKQIRSRDFKFDEDVTYN